MVHLLSWTVYLAAGSLLQPPAVLAPRTTPPVQRCSVQGLDAPPSKSAAARRRERRRRWWQERNLDEPAPMSATDEPPPAPAVHPLDMLLGKARAASFNAPAINELSEGSRVMVTAVGSSALGLAVETVACRTPGLVFADESAYPPGGCFGSEPVEVGDTVPAYVLKVRPDGRLDLVFRPVDPVRRLHEAAAALLAALVHAATAEGGGGGGALPLGDESDPVAVRQLVESAVHPV